MSTPPTLTKPAGVRRARYALQAFALLFAATAVCAFAGILGDRFPYRFDVTATREHHLSDRTTELLRSLHGEYELVVAANFSTLDQRAVRRTQDVLDNFSRASPNLRTTIIDVASPRGMADLDALLRRLVDRFGPDIEKQKAGLEAAGRNINLFVPTLSALSENLEAAQKTIKDGDPNAAGLRKLLGDDAGICGVAAEALPHAQTAATEQVNKTIGRTPVPATDDAVATVRKPLSDTLTQIAAIADQLEKISRSTDDRVTTAVTREQLKAPAMAANRLRTQIGETIAALDDLPHTPISSVLRVLERTSAAIVIGPPGAARAGVTSIELSSIYPPRPPEGADAPNIDLRARTEGLLAGALASLARSDSPIVVFVHGLRNRWAPDYARVSTIVDRLHLRGVEFAEWAAGVDPDPPSLKSLDPQGQRPVVYIVVSMAPDDAEAVARLGKLTAAAERLIRMGKPVLMCQLPSTLPSIGQKDPMAEMLVPLGINVETGRPLLRQVQGPRGRVVTPELVFTNPLKDHPIAKAIRGLVLDIPWASPVRIADGAAGVLPVVMIDNQGKSIWAESEYLGFMQTPPAQQPLLINPPAPDSSRDDTEGPWPLVVAVERSVGSLNQRVVVVGSNWWMFGDPIGGETETEGRIVLRYPGNIELFDASVYWLAGQDSMIAASPEAQAAPLVPPLSDAQLSALRWALIGGLPLALLLLGALWRLARG